MDQPGDDVIRNILWDVDGTLFDTRPAMTYALSKSLNEMGLTVAMNEIDGLVRRSLDDCIATLSERFKLDPNLLHTRFTESYLMIPPANQPPFPGVRAACHLIRKCGGLNIIVTHRSVESTQRLLNLHDLQPLFAGIFSVEQGYPRKPDPAMFEAAIQQFKLERTETLVIGDRGRDIQAGHAAGVRTCLFGDTHISEPADQQILHYSLLIEWLKKQNQTRRKNGPRCLS